MADYKGQVEFDETKIPVFEVDNDDFTLTLYNLNYGHDYVINVNDTQCDTRNGTQGGAQDKLQKQIFDMIEENLQISTSEIATRLGVGVRTVKRRIKQMTNMVYVANGYSGHWEIKYFLRQQYDFGLTVQSDCRQNAFGQHSRSVFLVLGSKSVYLINNKHFWVPLFPFLAIIFASFFRFMQANVSPTFISIRAFPIICV